MFNRHKVVLATGQSAPLPSTLFPEHRSEQVVKDEVKARPVRDEYAAVIEASRRLDAGLNVLVVRSQQQSQQLQPA
ncbi:MAG: hypothetical protein U1C47_02350 [Hydrogenophaga sp.]|nr:hypothetical protein [Hydrogenophaga sp.]